MENQPDITATLTRPKKRKTQNKYCVFNPISEEFFSLSTKHFTIGKSPSCDITLENNTISKFHATARLENNQLIIKDNNSRNGIYYGGVKKDSFYLSIGEHFYIGGVLLIFLNKYSKITRFGNLLTRKSDLIEQLNDLAIISSNPISILINGETGTGKELVAQFVHSKSQLDPNKFFTINCGAIPKHLMESQLFGHVKGAFSGAHNSRDGIILKAHKGTLFLDEIGELRPEHQSALLRFLETGKFRPVGSDRELYSEVRIIAATHKNLIEEVEKGNFRLDLWFRISGMVFQLPPLRERKEDIPLLIEQFGAPDVDYESIDALFSHYFMGNVRELKSMCKIAKIFGWKKIIENIMNREINLKNKNNENETTLNQDSLYMQIQENTLKNALEISGGNVSATARQLGIPRTTLINKLKKVGIK